MKKIVFLTGTRADFGKLKSLIDIALESPLFEIHIFATGMHMHAKFGLTVVEIEKYGYNNIYKYINQSSEGTMDITLAKTIEGLSNFVRELKPDLILVHGDRVETLAGAIVGSLNNILVSHIEGGEVSGTIDELIRHSVSKMSHSHFVSNEIAKHRLIQLGESDDSIFVIGSPDVDLMLSPDLPSLEKVKSRYDINFESFSIVIFHPVTTEYLLFEQYAKNLTLALKKVDENYIIIYPNNDLGGSSILKELSKLEKRKNIKFFPSLRFEYFLVLLREANMIIGNSSAGIREAPYYGTPTVNIGSRQFNRALTENIIHCDYEVNSIISALEKAKMIKITPDYLYGEGRSDERFFEIINKEEFWNISKQKIFNDIVQVE